MSNTYRTNSEQLSLYQLQLQKAISSCLPVILVPTFTSSKGILELGNQLEDLVRRCKSVEPDCTTPFHHLLLLPNSGISQRLYDIALRIGQIPMQANISFMTSIGKLNLATLGQVNRSDLQLEQFSALIVNDPAAQQRLAIAQARGEDAKHRLVDKIREQIFTQSCYLIHLVNYWQILGVMVAFELTRTSDKCKVEQQIKARIDDALHSSVPDVLHERLGQEAQSISSFYRLFSPFQSHLEKGLSAMIGEHISLASEQAEEALLYNCLESNFVLTWESGPLNTEERPSQKRQYEDLSHLRYMLKQQAFRERQLKGERQSSGLHSKPLDEIPSLNQYQEDCEQHLASGTSWTARVCKILCESGQTGSKKDIWYQYIAHFKRDKKFYLEQLFWREGLLYKTLGERTPRRIYPTIRSGHIEWLSEALE